MTALGHSQVLHPERVRALETWLEATNTKVTQVNGQRKYGGPPEVWHSDIPGDNCEVFISRIPRDVFEDLLIPVFRSVGPLWEFRLMMNFSGQNRGFAYAKYGSPAIADEAIHLLHNYRLEPGICLSVCLSTEKRHLCIGNLPTNTRQEDLLQVLRGLAEGVEGLSMKAGSGLGGATAVVAYSSHHTASMAKKKLVEAFKKQFALTVTVKWDSTPAKRPKDPFIPQKPATSLPVVLKPPPHTQGPPSHLDPPAPIRQRFCRAVSRPRAKQPPPCSSSSSAQGHVLATVSSVPLLANLCEAAGLSQPLYEITYSHTGQSGLVHLTYRVTIPGILAPFEGLVTVLLDPTHSTMEEEVQQAAAQDVLQRLYKLSLTTDK